MKYFIISILSMCLLSANTNTNIKIYYISTNKITITNRITITNTITNTFNRFVTNRIEKVTVTNTHNIFNVVNRVTVTNTITNTITKNIINKITITNIK